MKLLLSYFIVVLMLLNSTNAMSDQVIRSNFIFDNLIMEESLENLKNKYNIKVVVRGKIPISSSNFNIENATLLETVNQIATGYGIKNYSVYFEKSTNTLKFSILDQGGSINKSSKIETAFSRNDDFPNPDLIPVTTLTREQINRLPKFNETFSEYAHNDFSERLVTPLTFEQLAALENSRNSDNKQEDFNNFSPKPLSEEQLHDLKKSTGLNLDEIENPTPLDSEVIVKLKQIYKADDSITKLF